MSVTVKVEAVPVDVFHGELAQAPGFRLERFNDACTTRAHFIVRRVNVGSENPVHDRLEGPGFLTKENRHVIPRHSTKLATRIGPANVEAQRIPVMLLCA